MTRALPAGLKSWAWSARDRLVITAVAVAAHGLIVINNGIFWDDWALLPHIARGEWTTLQRWVAQVGGVPTYLYVWIAGASIPPTPVGFRVLALVVIAGSALLIYEIGVFTQLVGRGEAVVIACLAASFPGDHTHVELITFNYLFFFFLFLVAVWALFRAEVASGLQRRLLQVGGAALLFVSFGLNSLLVFFAGALLLGALYLKNSGRLATKEAILRESRNHAYLLLMPIVFWVIYRALLPPNGVYAAFHRFNWSLGSLVASAAGFWSSGVVAQFRDTIDALAIVPLLWLLLLIALQRVWPRFRPAFDVRPGHKVMLLFGAVLALLAVFPYIAVGLTPSDHGWNSRHTLLLGVPVAIVLVAAAHLLFPSRDRKLGLLGATAIASLMLGFILDSAYTYIEWEARWIKDSSVMANLATTPGAGGYSVYWIDDEYVVGGEPTYRFYEWSGMFRQVFGGETRIGLDRRATDPMFLSDSRSHFTDIYNLADFDPRGCEAAVTISRGRERHSDIGLVARYLFFGVTDPARQERMTRDITTVKVDAHASSFATDCRGA